jgi:hypothetical protein
MCEATNQNGGVTSRAPADTGERHQVRVTEAFAELGDPGERGDCRRIVSLVEILDAPGTRR